MALDGFGGFTQGLSESTRRGLLELRRLIEAAQARTVPAGTIHAWGGDGSTPPVGYLLCQGQAVSRETYSALFAVFGTTYGAGDGSTTFNLPDLRNRMIAGLGPDAWSNALGETGGAKDAVIVSHSHTTPNHDHSFSATTSSDSHSHTVNISHDHGNVTSAKGTQGNPSGWSTGASAGLLFGAGGNNGAGVIRSYSPSNWANQTIDVPPLGTTNKTSSSDSHTHTVSGTTGSASPSTNSTGVSGSNANLPPYITLHYVVKT